MSTLYLRIAARGPYAEARAPVLERCIARADARAAVSDWRAEAFRVIAPQSPELPAVGTAALSTAGRAAAGWVAVATPLHLIAGQSRVGMPPAGILALTEAEADALAADFNHVFGGEVRLLHAGRATLLCLFDGALSVETTPPELLPGPDLWPHLPRGADAARLRRLMSEIEMWLFDNPVNAARRARAAPDVSTLWLWGGGAADAPLPTVQGWTAGEDVFFGAFAPRSRYPAADEAGVARSGVVVLSDWPGSPAWREAEGRWLEPALADLAAGRVRRIELSAAHSRFSIGAWGLRRFWRGVRPWWEALGMGADPA